MVDLTSTYGGLAVSIPRQRGCVAINSGSGKWEKNVTSGRKFVELIPRLQVKLATQWVKMLQKFNPSQLRHSL